ncbi:MAG: mannose-1-phosphate guanylyltransferase [bacterium]
MTVYAVIMAGGVGSRFWPRSRERKPKQLIRILGEKSMIEETVERLDGLVEKKNIFVITNRMQKPRVKELLHELPEENIIDEPFGKNTAACIGLAAVVISKQCDDAVMITLPADHTISMNERFIDTLKKSCDFANESKGLMTIGISPNRPETGYGYIQLGDEIDNKQIYPVLTFAEKPNKETAEMFMASGDFLWNSGIFIWRVDVILEELKKHMPDHFEGFVKIKDSLGTGEFEKTLTQVYGQLRNVSIDYGIMEKSDRVFVTKGTFLWSDVGSWEAVYELSEKDSTGNAVIGDVYTRNSNNSYIFSPKKFTAIIGLDNIIVVDTREALLICNRADAQKVKEVVDFLKMNHKNDLI